ncbi:MAG: DUF2905 domain-containing protein [Candidatus Scalindua sp. AMX11]|nr:MAG: DUF2905 domain-containing protein [Candidatus Scalindua sp.]NOG83217.1 DUF2905 domain-containing protein [Planctomycetota bacterium]RZV77580.1 MAG: DUF2905 domain-containing protein [Candidatus Scalindua sp. SCAELEC01]TDE64541.1 MAG: DUF2905 domain-containing protein [Candidatus Scalindua sp. AMX11]
MPELGKPFILIGIFFVIIGLVLILGNNIPFLGKLPGDIAIKKKDFFFYFPVTTCIVVSIILTFIFLVFGRR